MRATVIRIVKMSPILCFHYDLIAVTVDKCLVSTIHKELMHITQVIMPIDGEDRQRFFNVPAYWPVGCDAQIESIK